MIGVVGPDRADRIATALERAGETVRTGEVAAVLEAEPALVVAVGTDALIDLVRAGVDVPALPVETGAGTRAVTVDDAVATADRLVEGGVGTRQLPTVRVRGEDGHLGRTLFDAMLHTSEPVRISEFEVSSGDVTDQVRADGVVVATPAGSHGYARRAGAPTLAAERPVAAVVPVGAFTMDPPSWVFDLAEPIRIAVTREDGGVGLVLDGREVRPIDGSVRITGGRALEVVDLDA